MIFKTIAATILGELSLVLLTTFVQEVLYNGISYNESPVAHIFIEGFLTFFAAIISGVIACYVGGKMNYWPHVIISIIIIVEMTYLITTGRTKDPLWFDIIAGLSLILGVWLGFLFRKNR